MPFVVLPVAVVKVASGFVSIATFALFLTFGHLPGEFDVMCVHLSDGLIDVTSAFFLEQLERLLIIFLDCGSTVLFILGYKLDQV